MNRKEAVIVLKEIFDKCKYLNGTYMALIPPNASSLLSQGYQVYIKASFDAETQKIIQKILEKYNCILLLEKEDVAIIYEPETKKMDCQIAN